jgi:hypothetical protein
LNIKFQSFTVMQVLNTLGFLNILKSGVLTGYALSAIEKVDWFKDSLGNYFIRITFIADHGCKEEELLIPLATVTNQPTWTNDISGANTAVSDILGFQNVASTVEQNILTTLQSFTEYEPAYVRDSAGTIFLEVRVWNQDTQTWSGTPTYYLPGSNTPSVPVGATTYVDYLSFLTAGLTKTTTVLRPSTSGTVAAGRNSVSIANVGTANGTVKGVTLKPGETLNFSGGAVNNKLDAIDYVATGTEFLIITVG